MPDIPLEDRVDEAFTPSDRDNTRLAALDIKEVFDRLRRLIDGRPELP